MPSRETRGDIGGRAAPGLAATVTLAPRRHHRDRRRPRRAGRRGIRRAAPRRGRRRARHGPPCRFRPRPLRRPPPRGDRRAPLRRAGARRRHRRGRQGARRGPLRGWSRPSAGRGGGRGRRGHRRGGHEPDRGWVPTTSSWRSSTGRGSAASASPSTPTSRCRWIRGARRRRGARPATGQEIAKTNAAAWQAAGYKGGGVKVGIVDFFDATVWNAAQTAGEVPAPAGTFCRQTASLRPVDRAAPSTARPSPRSSTRWRRTRRSTSRRRSRRPTSRPRSTTSRRRACRHRQSLAHRPVRRRRRRHGPDRPGRRQRGQPGHGVVQLGGQQRGQRTSNLGLVLARTVGRRRQRRLARVGAGRRADGPAVLRGGRFINGLRWSDWGANRTNYDLYLFENATGSVLKSVGTSDQTAGALPLEVVSRQRAATPTTSPSTWPRRVGHGGRHARVPGQRHGPRALEQPVQRRGAGGRLGAAPARWRSAPSTPRPGRRSGSTAPRARRTTTGSSPTSAPRRA